MNSLRPTLVIGAIFLLIFLSACTKNGCGKMENATANTESKQAPGQVDEFPSLSFVGLNAEQKKGIIKLFNDEICPCGCPKTFAQCLVDEDECKPGRLLAQWAADQLKSGAPERTLFQVLSEEINLGYMSKQIAINTEQAQQKGDKNAPITIVEFADFECPACKIAAKAIAALRKEKGKEIQLYFMHFPLSVHPQAEAAAVAAEAAGLQGKFWKMHDLLFDYEGPLSDKVLSDFANKIFGSNTEQRAKFETDRQDPKLLEKIRKQKDYAMNELRLMGTPSFFFNGRLYNLSLARDGFLLRIAMERARVGINCKPGQK